jgi:hypothetical protein
MDPPVVPPTSPCTNPNIIYGVIPEPGLGAPAGHEGIWEIDTQAGAANFILAVPPAGMYSAAVKSTHELYVHDDVSWQMMAFDLLTAVLSGTGLSAPNGAEALSEGQRASGELWTNLGLDLLYSPGFGSFSTVGTGQNSYVGDLVFSSKPATVGPEMECRLFGSVVPPDPGVGADFVRVSRITGKQAKIGNMSSLAVVGLAFDGNGNLWASERHHIRPVNPNTGVVGAPVYSFPAGLYVMDLASYPCRSCIGSDLGDAPDSTNHGGVAMSAYSGQLAGFPTVFDPSTGPPPGPKHLYPEDEIWLGPEVTGEDEADLPPDEDASTNLVPVADSADLDGTDDGLVFPVSLQHCQQSSFAYNVNVVVDDLQSGEDRYTNVWFDFNRDGDWSDTLTCQDPQRSTVTVYEWAVRNQPVTNLHAGLNLLTTPLFDVYDPSYPNEKTWMRISASDTLAEDPAGPALPDGRGPTDAFLTGETEDYLLVPTGSDYEYMPD